MSEPPRKSRRLSKKKSTPVDTPIITEIVHVPEEKSNETLDQTIKKHIEAAVPEIAASVVNVLRQEGVIRQPIDTPDVPSNGSNINKAVPRKVPDDGPSTSSQISGNAEALKSRAAQLLNESLNKTSRESYSRIFKFYEHFIEQTYSTSSIFPVSLEHLTMFIAHCFDRNLASSTILSYMSAISYMLQLRGYTDLTKHFIVEKTLRGYSNLRKSCDTRLPITPEILRNLVDSLVHTSHSKFVLIMVKSMYLMAFHAFLRIGEITGLMPPHGNALARKNIRFVFENDKDELPSAIEIKMSQYKHSTRKHIPVLLVQRQQIHKYCPVIALWEYLQLRGQESKNEQPLFSFMNNDSVSRNYFTDQLKLSLSFLGLHIQNYKSHSFRIGAATTAWAMGCSEEQIQQMGRWNSKAFKKYIRIPVLKL